MVVGIFRRRVDMLFIQGGYRNMDELAGAVPVGTKVEVLNNYGEVRSYTVTSLCDGDGLVVARTEIGEHPGEEVCLDSSMSDCYDVGWRKVC